MGYDDIMGREYKGFRDFFFLRAATTFSTIYHVHLTTLLHHPQLQYNNYIGSPSGFWSAFGGSLVYMISGGENGYEGEKPARDEGGDAGREVHRKEEEEEACPM